MTDPSQRLVVEDESIVRNLVENSLTGISIIQNNRFVYQNLEQKKLYDASSEKTLLQDLENVHPEDLVKVKAAYRRIMTDEVQSVETDFRFYPSGKVGNETDLKWIQYRATRFKYQGKDALWLNVVDVTKTKLLEHQLIIRNKMLSLGRVAAGIAHEIRNPLTGINSYLYTLDEMCCSETIETEDAQLMRQIVNQIQVASDKINLVIKRVMDFSKPGTPKMVLTNINESIEEAVKLSDVAVRKRGITIEKSLAPNLPRCYADPHLIEQVAINLVTNAANAMKKTKGSKIIKIGSFSENNTLFIKISDSGPGVPKELKEKIFDPFFTTDEDGSGIGLNIAQRIVADHNGSIALDTSEWGGAEFRIELPIERRMHPR